MHELGVLMQIAKTVHRIALQKGIETIKYITLEVGEISGFVPVYLRKLYPLVVDLYPVLQKAELHILMVAGRGLVIRDIGY